VFPAYLLAIFATGLVLSAWLRGGFRAVGCLAWWGTLLLGSFWVLTTGDDHPLIALTFLTGAWLMVHAAHFFATRPDPTVTAIPSGGLRDASAPAPGELKARWVLPLHEFWIVSSSFTFTTWSVGLSVWALHATTAVALPEWLPPFGFAGVACLLAASLAGRLRLLTDIPANGRERLGAALMTQTGALVIAGIALLATGHAAMLVWLAVGMAAIVAGRWIRSRGLDIYGVVVMCIGTGRWLVYESWLGGMSTPRRELGGIVVSQWLMFGLFSAAAWLAAGGLLRLNLPEKERSRPRPLAVTALALGLAVLMAAFVHQGAVGTSIAIAWLAIGVLAFIAGSFLRRTFIDQLGMIVLGIAVARLILWDSLSGYGAPGATVLGLVASRWMLACLLGAAVWLFLAVALPERLLRLGVKDEWTHRAGRAAAGLALLLAIIAAFNQHAVGTSVALAWVMLGLVAVLMAPLRPRLWLGTMGGAILALAAARLLFFDALLHMPRDGVAWHGLFLTRWGLAVWLAGGAWLVAGVVLSFRIAANPVEERMPAIATGGALALLMLAVYHPSADATAILWAWAGIATIALAAAHLRRTLRLDLSSAAAVGVCLAMWIVTYVLRAGADWTGAAAPLLLHPGLLSALCLAALLVAVAHWGVRGRNEVVARSLRAASLIAAVGLIWGSTTLEAARVGAALTGDQTVRLATISIWWGLFAVALIVGGFVRSVPLARRAGLTLMAAAGVKVVVFDLGGVPQVWRIASFLLLGLLMIGIAMGYSRISGKLAPKP
jgi:hypothetical protein